VNVVSGMGQNFRYRVPRTVASRRSTKDKDGLALQLVAKFELGGVIRSGLLFAEF